MPRLLWYVASDFAISCEGSAHSGALNDIQEVPRRLFNPDPHRIIHSLLDNSINQSILYFQADLLTLFYMWFPCCTCLRVMINRSYSVTTKETFLIRHQSKSKNRASNRKDKLQKRLLIVEKRPGCSGSQNLTCDEEHLELVCKLFVDNVSELASVQDSCDQWLVFLFLWARSLRHFCLWKLGNY